MNTKSISDKLMKKETSKKSIGLGRYPAIINCLMGSVVSVMTIMVFAFIQMMFKSGEDGRRETFFGSLYFEATTLNNGDVEINMGLDNGLTIVLVIAVVALIYYLLFAIVVNKSVNKKEDKR